MNKTFYYSVTTCSPRPRSKRLRLQGSAPAASSTVTYAGGTAATPSAGGDGHTHANLADLDKITTDADGYQWLTDLREETDPETGTTTYTRTPQKVKAGYADEARELSPDSPTREDFVSAKEDDEAAGNITFRKNIYVKESAEVSGKMKVGDELNVGGNLSVSGTSDLQGKATARGGVQYGASFVPGLTGKGGLIDGEGRGEMRSLRLWEFLEVPELRYNRVNVYTGIRWDTFGAGLVERVDTATGGLWLHLEEGEIGLIEPYDLCMGIWHDYDGGNATATSDDRRGNFSFAGFKTSYFMVTDVPDTDPDGAANTDKHYFTYELREGYAVHPASQMSFACRGNRVHTARQSFTYTTTEYSLLLAGVNDWEFTDSMYKGITGRLDGFSLGGKSFNGYGTVLGNAYIFGQIDQFEKAGRTLGIRDTLGGLMAEGETDTLELRVIDGYGRNVTAEYATWSVSRDTGDATADAAWAVTAPSPELADTEDGKAARLSLGYDDLGSGLQALFTFRATDSSGQTLTQSLTIA